MVSELSLVDRFIRGPGMPLSLGIATSMTFHYFNKFLCRYRCRQDPNLGPPPRDRDGEQYQRWEEEFTRRWLAMRHQEVELHMKWVAALAVTAVAVGIAGKIAKVFIKPSNLPTLQQQFTDPRTYYESSLQRYQRVALAGAGILAVNVPFGAYVLWDEQKRMQKTLGLFEADKKAGQFTLWINREH